MDLIQERKVHLGRMLGVSEVMIGKNIIDKQLNA